MWRNSLEMPRIRDDFIWDVTVAVAMSNIRTNSVAFSKKGSFAGKQGYIYLLNLQLYIQFPIYYRIQDLTQVLNIGRKCSGGEVGFISDRHGALHDSTHNGGKQQHQVVSISHHLQTAPVKYL